MKSKTLFILFLLCSAIAPVAARADVIVVALMDESAVALVDVATQKQLVKFATGRNPHEVRISPDKRFAYVAAGKYVTAIDLVNRRLKRTFDLGDYSAHDIRISKDGQRFWAACARAKAVVEVDIDSGEIIKTYDTKQEGAWFVEVTPDERTLVTPNLEGKSVSIIDRAAGTVKVIPLESPGYGIDITPDGKYVWVSGGDLAVIDLAAGTITARIPSSEKETGRLRMTSDGRRVVVALSNKLAIYDARTRKLINEVQLPHEPKVMTLSGDGRFAYLSNPGAHSMSVVNISDRTAITIATGRKPDGVGWAP